MSSPQWLSPQKYDRTPTKLIPHSQRLKNYKKIFNQLHKTQIHTYIVRKNHLQQSLNLLPKNKSIHDRLPSVQYESTEQDLSKSRIKSKSQQKQKSEKSQARRESIEIVKKMLQISTVQVYNNRTFFSPIQMGDLGRTAYGALGFNGNGNEDGGGFRANSRLLQKSEENHVQSRNSMLEMRKSNKQVSRLRHNNSDINKYPTPPESISPHNPNYPQPSITHKRQSSKHNSRNSHNSHPKPTISPKKQKTQTPLALSLDSYIKFINSPPTVTQLHIHFNFSAIRQMSSAEAWKNLDIKNARIIQNLLANILTNLEDPDILKPNTDANPNPVIEQVRDCCRLYFNNYQKIKLQLILKQHYFKLFAFKLNPIFVYQRITLYFCYMSTIPTPQKPLLQKLISSLSLLKKIYSLILNVVKQIQITKPTVKNIVGLTSQGQVQGTFQILRTVGEMERYIGDLRDVVQVMQFFIKSRVQVGIEEDKGDKGTGNGNAYGEIYRVLCQYLKEEFYGIGVKTYENFVKSEMLLSWKYLQVPPTPFLPPIHPSLIYTIVLDIDQTLTFYSPETQTLKFRPSLDTFLKTLQSLKFELITFTASSKPYADAIISQIQRKQHIFSYRLYKEHLSLYQGRLVKDLRRLGRDMGRVVVVDDLRGNFGGCADNGVEVGSWLGGKGDKQLLVVLDVLKKVQGDEVKDLRKILKENRKYLQQMLDQQPTMT